MYQPRRATAAAVKRPDAAETTSAFQTGPRRAAAPEPSFLWTWAAPATVSATVVASVTALTLSSAPPHLEAVPAPAANALAANAVAADALAAGTEADVDPATVVFYSTELEVPTTPKTQPRIGDSDEIEVGKPAGKRYVQRSVTVRELPDKDTDRVGSLAPGAALTVTDEVIDGYRQVTYKGDIAYVFDKYLAKTKPEKPAAGASATGGKYTGSTALPTKTVLGLKPKAMVVYNAVTARWSFSSIGGYRANSLSNHQLGGAIDFMLTPGKDSAKGWAVAKWLAANAQAFEIDHIIFEQHIWTPRTPVWRSMADRGGTTANHYDHVHVSVKL